MHPIKTLMEGFVGKRDLLEGIDLQKEYLLIKEKKSKLSASLRRAVVYRVEHAGAIGEAF
jgi:hypothetical protein